ncbi:hypothetical protein [Escherichia coli]|uniref:hypothetical protein n=1 Tax=Escherichia coli TaxID=562 RepID=UPI00069BD638|nr:hypothetical protein [Escherichia coli]EHE2558662.1 hypothetical protein [Escherichia coli]KOA35428.1 hypothetical protein AC067_08770 [Escherichia coli]QJU24630.1 hypothetical protein HLY11_05135 [Escherichia coli]HEC5119846.1 hypothetical protein [Escherichia coli]
MNNKYFWLLVFFILPSSFLFYAILIINENIKIDCVGALLTNKLENPDDFFSGTLSMDIQSDSVGIIRVFGSVTTKSSTSGVNHYRVNRDITFDVMDFKKNTFYISEVKTIAHPGDNVPAFEFAGYVVNVINFDSDRIVVSKHNNTFIFGGETLPSFICVKNN